MTENKESKEQKEIKEFKDRLRELRHSRNYTQKELGELMYVSRSTVAKWEAGLVLPTDEYLDRLCGIFNVSREAFFTDEEQEKLNSRKNRTIFQQKKLIVLMSAALLILLALAIVLPILVRHHRVEPTVPERIPAPVITLNGGDDYLGFGVTRPYEQNGQIEVTVVTNVLGKDVLRSMTVNAVPDGGRILLGTDFACEAIAAYYYEINDGWLYVKEDGETFDPDERKGFFNLDFATPLTVTGSAPDYSIALPTPSIGGNAILVRFEITVCGDTFRYFALYQ